MPCESNVGPVGIASEWSSFVLRSQEKSVVELLSLYLSEGNDLWVCSSLLDHETGCHELLDKCRLTCVDTKDTDLRFIASVGVIE